MLRLMMDCGRGQSGVTRRDGLVGAGVMLASTALCAGLGIALRRSGWPVAGETLKSLAFPASLTLSMPWWLMKGAPRTVKALILGGTLLVLAALSWMAAVI